MGLGAKVVELVWNMMFPAEIKVPKVNFSPGSGILVELEFGNGLGME